MVARIEDVTPLFRAVGERLAAGDAQGAAALLPDEEVYPMPLGCAIAGEGQQAAAAAAGARC